MAAKVTEMPFRGNSDELYSYLYKKYINLEMYLKWNRKKISTERVSLIEAYIDILKDMTSLDFFHEKDNVYTMWELIQEIKSERLNEQQYLSKLEPELKNAKILADQAFENVNRCLISNVYDENYDSLAQKEARFAIDEYEAMAKDYSDCIAYRKLLWQLLGVINRPEGFFSKLEVN